METVHIDTKQRAYDILIGSGLLNLTGKKLREIFPSCPSVMIISDDIVAPLWCDTVFDSIESAGIKVNKFIFPHGENSKNLPTVSAMLEYMEICAMQRSSVVVALGGGVVGDMAGLAAALFMRGIPFIQIPTTLLAAQDSSVGGKTAVNMSSKNIVGAFWQPSVVICDCDTLQTLPPAAFADGMAEMIKHGIISDTVLLDMLSHGEHIANLPECIRRSVSVKASVVSTDELDTGLRQLLNFGHTVGHAIEHCTNYNVTHGSAVSAGMCIMSRSCESVGIAKPGTSARIEAILSSCNLPVSTDCDPEELYFAALMDKKRSGSEISLIRIRSVGDCYISREPISSLEKIIKAGI